MRIYCWHKESWKTTRESPATVVIALITQLQCSRTSTGRGIAAIRFDSWRELWLFFNDLITHYVYLHSWKGSNLSRPPIFKSYNCVIFYGNHYKVTTGSKYQKPFSWKEKKKHIFNAIAIHSPWWHYVKEKCIDVEGEGLICMYLDLPRG